MRSDSATTAYAWSRYRRLLRWLLAVAMALMVVAARLAIQHAGSTSIRRYVLAALAVGLAMLGSSAVMGLVFLKRSRWVSGENPLPARPRSDVPE